MYGEERETNKMQPIWCLLSNVYLNMLRASLRPSSGEPGSVLPHVVFCTGCAVCGWLWSCGAASWAVCTVWKLLFDFHTVHAAHDTAPQDHSQHNQWRTPHAVGHSLILLMMGIMMPETCWDRSLIINIGLVASCWFSLHLMFMMHGHKNLKLTCMLVCSIVTITTTTTIIVAAVRHMYIFFCREVSQNVVIWLNVSQINMSLLCFQMHGWWNCPIWIASIVLQTHAAPACRPWSTGTCHTCEICKTLVRNSIKNVYPGVRSYTNL